MNAELQEQASNALALMIQDATAVREFAIEQAPDVVRQLLAYNVWANLFGLALAAIVTASLLRVLAWRARKVDGPAFDDGAFACIATFSCVIVPLALIACACCIFELLKLWIAPKVWLLEYAADLV